MTHTLDKFGKATYYSRTGLHDRRDEKDEAACPDTTQGGTLFVFGPNGNRVPVRFVYPKT